MSKRDPYPDSLGELVHQLYYEQRKTMREVLPILKKKYPKYAKRITVDRMQSVARLYRKKKGLPAKNENMSKGQKKRAVLGPQRKEIIEEARRLKQKNYRWQAVVEELKVKFPKANIPPAGALSNIVRGKKVKNNNQTYRLAITAPSGTVINMELSSKKFDQFLKNLLEV